MSRTILVFAAILGFTGVAIGAFGAHGLQATLTANGTADTFQTASRYHMYHALALIGTAWLASRAKTGMIRAAGYLLFAGALIFSGSLYILAITNIKILGAVAPIGGVLMLAGWVCFGLAAWRSTDLA
jgi:uncharacterized membrane protein YgdD (TMEM256/DUF423 family)